MKIKNLRINSQRIKALVGAVLLLVTLPACSSKKENNNGRKTYTLENSVLNDQELQYLFVDDRLVSIDDVRLGDSTGKVVDSVDGVIVNDEIMNVENPIDVAFGSDIESVVIDNRVIPVTEFTVVDNKSGELIDDINGAFVNNQLVSLAAGNGNSSSTKEDLEEDVYEELTTEKFYELVNAKIEECKEKGIAFDEADIEKLVMFVNINKLLVDNPELVTSIVGGENLTEDELTNIMLDGEQIQDTFSNYNLETFRATKSTDGYILISDVIFDFAERNKAIAIEDRVNEIGSYARTDVDKMNELITFLLTDLYDPTEDIYNLESGTSYGLRYILTPIRALYGKNECEDTITLNDTNKEFIQYFVSYMEDDFEYYINGWGTAAYQNVYGILNNNNCKTLTR